LRSRLLEQSRESVEEVARACGFGTAAVLRHHFVRTLGTTPTEYRRAFGVGAEADDAADDGDAGVRRAS